MVESTQSGPVTIFIGSSSEGSRICDYLQEGLERVSSCEVTTWQQGVFRLSIGAMETLANEATKYDFAILVATADDVVSSRGATGAAPRDNVIFELGLFMGAIGRERTYLVVVDQGGPVRLPSDLHGITWVPVRHRADGNYRSAVSAAVLAVSEQIDRLGPRPKASTSRGLSQIGSPAAHDGNDRHALEREVEQICRAATAQGWRIRTRSTSTLRLESPRGQRHTFSFGAPRSSRERLRPFVAKLRASGFRVEGNLRRSVDDSPL